MRETANVVIVIVDVVVTSSTTLLDNDTTTILRNEDCGRLAAITLLIGSQRVQRTRSSVTSFFTTLVRTTRLPWTLRWTTSTSGYAGFTTVPFRSEEQMQTCGKFFILVKKASYLLDKEKERLLAEATSEILRHEYRADLADNNVRELNRKFESQCMENWAYHFRV